MKRFHFQVLRPEIFAVNEKIEIIKSKHNLLDFYDTSGNDTMSTYEPLVGGREPKSLVKNYK